MKRSINEYDEGRGGSGKLFKAMEAYGGPAALAGSGAAGYADYKLTKQREQDKSEAAAEMKRESRGVPKPANFDAMQESIQDAKDAKDRKKISDMGYAKGGMTAKFMSFSKKGQPAGMKPVTKMASGGSASSRADGCAIRGKTRA